MNHLTHPHLYEEHAGISAISPAKVLALSEALRNLWEAFELEGFNENTEFQDKRSTAVRAARPFASAKDSQHG